MAPGPVERLSAEMFFRPMRARREAVMPAVHGRPVTRFTVASGEYELAAWSWGEGPTVLLVHGWEGRAKQLLPFVAPLLAEGFRVVTFDQPAHGGSTGRRVTVLDMASAARDVARDVAPLIGLPTGLHGVVAHSLGGTATALALHQGLSAKRVVLLAPAAEPSHFARRAASELGLSAPLSDGMLRRVLAQLGSDLAAIDVRSLAPSFDVPALVMHDPEDRDVPWEHGRGIAEAWPGARLAPLHGLGHRRLLADAEVHRRTARFLTAIDDA
ncbi:MAG: alpha/beta fold hydrolase [Byssovorax sp.]